MFKSALLFTAFAIIQTKLRPSEFIAARGLRLLRHSAGRRGPRGNRRKPGKGCRSSPPRFSPPSHILRSLCRVKIEIHGHAPEKPHTPAAARSLSEIVPADAHTRSGGPLSDGPG